jgi:hypothetical protein
MRNNSKMKWWLKMFAQSKMMLHSLVVKISIKRDGGAIGLRGKSS